MSSVFRLPASCFVESEKRVTADLSLLIVMHQSRVQDVTLSRQAAACDMLLLLHIPPSTTKLDHLHSDVCIPLCRCVIKSLMKMMKRVGDSTPP